MEMRVLGEFSIFLTLNEERRDCICKFFGYTV